MEDFRTIGHRLSNWGRWGPADEVGTLNHITPERLVAASRLVLKGQVFDLGIPFDSTGPQTGRIRINPVRLMSENGSDQALPGAFRYADDYVFMSLQSGSQWDALAHVYYDDFGYNEAPATGVTIHGAKRNSIDKIAKGVAGRGVLVDLPRFQGVDWLEGGQGITPSDLDAALLAQNVTVGPGDILLLRTGWRQKFLTDHSGDAFQESEPGLTMACADWLAEREVAAVAADNCAVEVVPGEYPDETLPLHMVLIRDMGMTLGEILDFEELAEACASDGVFEFLFCGPPIKFTGAVGSPINPLAIK